MIRILQQDNKLVKILFAVIIGLAVITMVITLVPGIFDNAGSGADAANYSITPTTGPKFRHRFPVAGCLSRSGGAGHCLR